jgi:hypothetical protein
MRDVGKALGLTDRIKMLVLPGLGMAEEGVLCRIRIPS